MQRLLLFGLLLLIEQQTSAQITFCGSKSYPALSFSTETKAKLEADAENAKSIYLKDITSADALIGYGRRLAYLGKYDEAIADFTKAAALIKGKPDEVEPDGMPNAQNIPTSTLQSNIWYHLGLAYYLKGDFAGAETVYKHCLKVSANPDMYVATVNWYYITLRQQKKEKEAAELLQTISKDMKLIENEGYLTILLLYKGEQDAGVLYQQLMGHQNTLNNATLGFGLGNYYLLSGQTAKGKSVLNAVLQGNQWGSFAYMASEKALSGIGAQ